MKEVKVMSLGGMVISLEQDAKDAIDKYLEKNRLLLKGDEGANEILQDLEAAIGSHLVEQGYNEKRAASKTAVEEVLSLMGEVTADDDESTASRADSRHQFFKEPFYLSKNNKVIFGLAGSIAERIGIDAFWVRILFVFLALIPYGWFVFVYFAVGIVLSILEESQPVNAKTVSAQVRRTSIQASGVMAKGWRRTLQQIDGVSRKIFRAIAQLGSALLLTASLTVLCIATVSMVATPRLNIPFVGYDRTLLAYLFVLSGLLLITALAGVLVFTIFFGERLKRGKIRWQFFLVLLPTILLTSTWMSSGYLLRHTITDWGLNNPNNRFLVVERNDKGSTHLFCISPFPSCDPGSRHIQKIELYSPDGNLLHTEYYPQ
jgi:phage shock protein PspC (stress-responsive transcriptional regulator)